MLLQMCDVIFWCVLLKKKNGQRCKGPFTFASGVKVARQNRVGTVEQLVLARTSTDATIVIVAANAMRRVLSAR